MSPKQGVIETEIRTVGEYLCPKCGMLIGERVQIGEGDDGPVALRIGNSTTLWLEAHNGICMTCGYNVHWSTNTQKMAAWLSQAAGRAVSAEELDK